MQKKIFFTPMTDYAPSGEAQNPSGKAQPYLPHVTRRVPRSVHAKFHADWTKTVGARGIHLDKQTNRQTHRQSYFDNIDITIYLKVDQQDRHPLYNNSLARLLLQYSW